MQQSQRHRAADTAAGAGHERDLSGRSHGLLLDMRKFPQKPSERIGLSQPPRGGRQLGGFTAVLQ